MNLVAILMTVICVARALQARPRFVAYDDSEADGKDRPNISSMGFVIPGEANSKDGNREYMQISNIQKRGFLDEANDAIEDAKSVFGSVHSYVKQAGILKKKIIIVDLFIKVPFMSLHK